MNKLIDLMGKDIWYNEITPHLAEHPQCKKCGVKKKCKSKPTHLINYPRIRANILTPACKKHTNKVINERVAINLKRIERSQKRKAK